MTHDECISQIVQAVHAANQGNPQELHHLASLLEGQAGQAHEQEPEPAHEEPDDAPAPQVSADKAPWQTPRIDTEPIAEEGR